jgi:hypothetical protein
LAAADSSIEEDRDRNMVATITIRAATAIVIRIMAAPLFGRDCVWRVTASVELIGWYPVADMRTQIERAALRRYFSLGKSVTIVAKHPAKTRRHLVKLAGVNRRAPFRSSQTTVDQVGVAFDLADAVGEHKVKHLHGLTACIFFSGGALGAKQFPLAQGI